MSKKNNKEVITTAEELLKDDLNFGLYTIRNNITGFSGTIMREPTDSVAYERSIKDVSKVIEEQNSEEKLSNFSIIRLGVYNLETCTIINIDRLVMPLGVDTDE